MDIDVRPEVQAFAKLMEAKLRENDHKNRGSRQMGWKNEATGYLLRRIRTETKELVNAIKERHRLVRNSLISQPWLTQQQRCAAQDIVIGREAADVANFAMFIADVCGALKHG